MVEAGRDELTLSFYPPIPTVCEDILKVLDDHLIKSAESGESKVRFGARERVARETGELTLCKRATGLLPQDEG